MPLRASLWPHSLHAHPLLPRRLGTLHLTRRMSANAASSATDPAFFVCSSPDVAKSSSAHQKVLGLERWVQGRDVHVMTSPPSTESWSKIRPWDKSFDIPTFFQHLKTRPGDGYGRSLLYRDACRRLRLCDRQALRLRARLCLHRRRPVCWKGRGSNRGMPPDASRFPSPPGSKTVARCRLCSTFLLQWSRQSVPSRGWQGVPRSVPNLLPTISRDQLFASNGPTTCTSSVPLRRTASEGHGAAARHLLQRKRRTLGRLRP